MDTPEPLDNSMSILSLSEAAPEPFDNSMSESTSESSTSPKAKRKATKAKKTTKKPRVPNPHRTYRNLPWAEIEIRFIQGYPRYNETTRKAELYKPTLQDISDEYKVPIDVVTRQAKKLRPSWTEKRDAFKARQLEQGGTEHIWRMTQMAIIDAGTLDIAKRGLSSISDWLTERMELDPAERGGRFSTKEIADIASATLSFQNLARKSLSEPVSGLDPELRAVVKEKSRIKSPSDIKQLTSQAKALITRAQSRDKAKAAAIQAIEASEEATIDIESTEVLDLPESIESAIIEGNVGSD